MPRVTASPLPPGMPTLPEREGEFKRLLNSLNGAELRQLIVANIAEALANDRRFANHLTFPLAAVSIRIDVAVQPREEPNFFLEKSMAFAEMAKDEDGEPLDGRTIELDADWPPAVLINLRTFLGLEDAPDTIREANGMEVPRARRQQGSPSAYEEVSDRSRSVRTGTPGDQEEAVLAEFPEAFQVKYRDMKKSDPIMAKRLLESVKITGYKHHPDSPLLDAPKVVTLEEDRARRPGSNAAKRASVPPGNQVPSPVDTLREVVQEQDQKARSVLPPRTVVITPGGANEQRAMKQMQVGAPPANKEVKFSLEDAPQGAPGLDNYVEADKLKE